MHVLKDNGTYLIEDINLKISSYTEEKYSILYDHTDSAEGKTKRIISLKRGEWEIKTRHQTLLTSDKDNFIVYATLDAYENNMRIFSKNWHEKIPRKFI